MNQLGIKQSRMNQSIGINLATQPFGRERARIAMLAGVCAVLSLSLGIFLILIAKERAQVSTLHRTIRIEQQQLAALDRQQNQFQSVIGRPANADVFSKSVFYNELIARRAVSWTRVFEDLGHVMPRTVQLVSLRLPQVVASSDRDKNHIELNMLVGTQQPAAILQLLKNLGSSTLFGATVPQSQQPPTQNDPLFRYTLTVPYVQKF
jgi:Tfp pilus assembly protein PilN